MARYRLTAPHYLAPKKGLSQHFPAGVEVDWDGVPSSAMEPLDAAARAAIAKHKPRGFDINSIAPLSRPSLPGAGDEASTLYPGDPLKQQAMRDRTAKARAAAAAKREAAKTADAQDEKT